MKDNTIIAYIDGYAIILLDNGTLGYEQIDEEFAEIGEILIDYKYKPISELSEDIQNKIQRALETGG